MASLKVEKSVGTSLFGQVKKEPAKVSTDGAPKPGGSKPSASKKAAPKSQEPKKKRKGGKSSAKN
ncbi:hypothetical protein K2173_017028 [Erythroxylum novogranatense]|uniref:Uncharacterized protein n=1 Tax=Erythroxylum novogranatense TaxID=1862640 RepID=A0AAV8U5I4_9ROSI|nr:hypothetical protein K2173_017028 [Erythroxylum novogranatense]